LIERDEAAQTVQYLHKSEAILMAAGFCLDKAVIATVVLSDEDDFAAVNEEWLKCFQPIYRPAKVRN